MMVNNILYRNRGFKSALKARGLTLREEDIVALEPTMDGSYRDMSNWLERRKDPLPTGFFAVNDIVAMGAMRAFAVQDIRVPEDMSIVGMDNMPFSRITFPSLTTLDVPKRQISELAVERLIKLAEQPDELCLKIAVGTNAIIRGSTKSIR